MQKQRDVIQVPRLEPKDLFDKRTKRDYARLRAYNQLLEQIYNRVYSSSQLSGTTASILYTVPPFILGLPKLDLEDCIVYLVFQLRQTGFEVRFTYPNLLWISWRHHETDYIAKQNPIIKAMIPEKPKAVPKPKKVEFEMPSFTTPSKTYTDDISLITGHAPSAMFSQPPKRAADYEPPTSFIQNMDRPVKETRTGGILDDLWKI